MQGTLWKFDNKCMTTFNELKQAFTYAPILTHWISDQQLVVETNASNYAIATILSINLEDSEIHPNTFLSWSLHNAELNYDTHDKELLAIFEAFKYWCHYLEGSVDSIDVVMDYKNLEYFSTIKILTQWQVQWSGYLSQFNLWSIDESDILYLDNRIYVLDSENLHLHVLQNNHDHILAGHFGQNQTLELVQQNYTTPLIPKNSPSYLSLTFSPNMIYLTTSPLTTAPNLFPNSHAPLLKPLTWNSTSLSDTIQRPTDKQNVQTKPWNSTSVSTVLTNRTTEIYYYPVEENTIPNHTQPLSPPVKVEDEEQYKIAQIFDSMINCWFQCPLLYRIQWLGYEGTNEEFAWLPATKFSTDEFIEDFHCHYPDKPKPLAKVTI
ncbi:uncharacterized protein ARMOST_11676 [Armillaria ostoyae]|uniref:Chromo domain-containing protein n=1 Tax=Armillaria ostoyae TaxID=47428 RepID=A0A284RHU2_ARMOS|nr:uncharacterized protein ARMOST_11676 [Armillaria ostoyae]